MADGFAALDAQIARPRSLPGLPGRAAPAIAREVERELRALIASGRGPDGKPWRARKDGGRPLQNAAEALRVRAVRGSIVITLEGVEVLHHLGRARGGVRRPIIPTNELPDALTRAIERVLERAFAKHMGAA